MSSQMSHICQNCWKSLHIHSPNWATQLRGGTASGYVELLGSVRYL